jgi:hypothetical protein
MTAKINAAAIKTRNNTFKPDCFTAGVGFESGTAVPDLDRTGGDDEGGLRGVNEEPVVARGAGRGNPHEGQDTALSEMRCLHSGHSIRAICAMYYKALINLNHYGQPYIYDPLCITLHLMPLESPDKEFFNAAVGYTRLRMFLEANEQL